MKTFFLLGATNNPSHISGKSQWLKDDNGNLVVDDRDYDSNKKENYGIVCSPTLKKLLKKKNIKENQLGSCKHPGCPPDSDCEACKNEKEIGDLPLYLTVLKSPKVFEYKGEIWHHFVETTPQYEVLARCGSWVKTSYSAFLKAFSKDKHMTAKDAHKSDWYNVSDFNTLGKDPYQRSFGITYCKDHLEVFIEKL